MATILEIASQLEESIRSFSHGLWAPIYWAPSLGSDERFMVAAAIVLGNHKKVLRIVDNSVLKAFYLDENKRASNIVDFIVNILNTEIQEGKNINELSTFSENFVIGTAKKIAAPDMTKAVIQIIQRYSSIMTEERYLNMLSNQMSIKDNDWTKSVKSFCNNYYDMPSIGSFDKRVWIGKRAVNTFFSNCSMKFVAFSMQLNSEKQIPQLCMKSRDSDILLRNHGVERAITLIKNEENTMNYIDRFQFEQKQCGLPLLDYWAFNSPVEVATFLKDEAVVRS